MAEGFIKWMRKVEGRKSPCDPTLLELMTILKNCKGNPLRSRGRRILLDHIHWAAVPHPRAWESLYVTEDTVSSIHINLLQDLIDDGYNIHQPATPF